ncbi:tonB-dependent receptor SusC [Flavobacteriaceae bacterium UJ101]|nr:tonB-dependent receptor SusC [Flavobacteriaceae bacterium UJ101]
MRKKCTNILTLFMLFVSTMIFAQIQVSGIVKDDAGEPLPGTYVENESGESVETDIDGKYTITANQGEELTFSFIGMDDVVKTVSGNSLNVTLGMDDGNVIDDVVVIGYGITMDENEKAGAIVTVGSDVLEQNPSTSIDQALQGEVPGLNLSTNGGQPGATNTVVIRGIGTLSGESNPLYVVDGVILGRGEDNSSLVTSFNPLASIDPNNIKSVTVLKDAMATSIYGSLGAAGVIVVETKTGRKNQKTKFTLLSETSFSDIAFDDINVYDAEGYINLSAEGLVNAGFAGTIAEGVDLASNVVGWDGTTNTDWEDAVQRSTGTIYSNSLSFTGGSEKSTFNGSIGLYQNKPLAKETQFDRVTGSFRFNHDVTDKFNIGLNTQFSNLDLNTPSDASSFSNPFFARFTALPTSPIYNEDGSYNTSLPGFLQTSNPVGNLEKNFTKGEQMRLIGAFNAGYDITDYLKFDTKISGNYQDLDERQYWNPYFGDGLAFNGYGAASSLEDFQWSWTNFLRFKKEFNDVHSLKVDVGMDYLQETVNTLFTAAQNFSGDFTYLDSAAEKTSASTNKYERSLVSYISRVTYAYDDRYVVNGFFRREGSSKLINKWDNFFGVGLTWNVINESFMENSNVLSDLRLRANYGETGNDPFSFYTSWYNGLPQVSTGFNYGDNPGLTFEVPGNDQLTWERTKQWNFGLDYGFANNRITGTIDYYIKNGEDLFVEVPLTPSQGFPTNSQTGNAADIRNTGLEFLIKAKIFKGEGFNWTATGNFAFNDNEIKSLPDGEDIQRGNKILRVGEEVGMFYDYGYAGVDPSNGNALFYTDETKSATTSNLNEAAQFIQGRSLPKYTAGLKNNLSFKGVYINTMFNYAGDFKVWDRWAFVYDSDGSYSTVNPMVRDHWTPDNTDAKYPKYVWGNASRGNTGSRYIYDGDYIRLKDLKIGYKFSDEILDQIGLDALELYVRGTNLWTYTFDDDLYFDPESTSNAYSGDKWVGTGVYDLTSPLLKTYSFGVVVGF